MNLQHTHRNGTGGEKSLLVPLHGVEAYFFGSAPAPGAVNRASRFKSGRLSAPPFCEFPSAMVRCGGAPDCARGGRAPHASGSVLIIVLWVIFGLVSIALYFAHSMTLELRASDSRVAGIEAEEAIEGARRYISCLLSNVNSPGVLPDTQSYPHEAVAVGKAHFWIIGRGSDQDIATEPHFGLVDEASKINLNSATSNVLINLPRMTADLANNITAWRSTNTSSTSGGAESSAYLQLSSPYICKNNPFETVDELRLVYSMDMETLCGEDANLNGILDDNENDGDTLAPSDNSDGKLDPGLLEYCTVYTREPANATNGTARFNLTTYNRLNPAGLVTVMTTNGISESRARQIIVAVGGTPIPTPLNLYYAGKLTTAEFAQIETAVRGATLVGLINVNTASLAVLNSIPGWTSGQASQVIAYRNSNSNSIYAQGVSMGWITQVLSQTDVLAAAPYITGHGYQFSADIAAIGHNGLGYRRCRFVFDTSRGTPAILHRQDLSHLGWALGKEIRDKWLLAKQ
jgi:DNA uptake protein ComE-like DNA-binding protein